jgi:hypothetical protein
MKPYLVAKIISPDGKESITQPRQIRRVISERASLLISGMMVNVVDEGHAKRAQVDGYYVADETFNDRTDKITKFADAVEALPFHPWFSGYIRADLLVSRPRDREELLRMGFRGHYYGIESLNHSSAKAVGKGMNPDRLKDGLLDVKQYFENNGTGLYRAELGFIIGLPEETQQSLELTKKWVTEHWKGHSWKGSLLEIFQNELDKPSRLSMDYKKFGYQAMTPAEISKYQDYKLVFSGLSVDALIWKNSTMDIFQASIIEKDWYHASRSNDKPGDFTITSWNLASVLLYNLDLKQRLLLQITICKCVEKSMLMLLLIAISIKNLACDTKQITCYLNTNNLLGSYRFFQ